MVRQKFRKVTIQLANTVLDVKKSGALLRCGRLLLVGCCFVETSD